MDASVITPFLTSAISGIFGTIGATLIARWQFTRDIATSPTMPLTSSARKRRWVFPAIVGLLCLILGGAGGYVVTSPTFFSSCPIVGSADVKIISPAEESSVSRMTIVKGRACHIPEGRFLWLVVVSGTVFQGYYPQAGPIAVSSDGAWSTITYIGDQTSNIVGHSYKLIPVLVDQAGSAIFGAARNNPQVNKRGVLRFPPGAQLMTDTLVIRG